MSVINSYGTHWYLFVRVRWGSLACTGLPRGTRVLLCEVTRLGNNPTMIERGRSSSLLGYGRGRRTHLVPDRAYRLGSTTYRSGLLSSVFWWFSFRCSMIARTFPSTWSAMSKSLRLLHEWHWCIGLSISVLTQRQPTSEMSTRTSATSCLLLYGPCRS